MNLKELLHVWLSDNFSLNIEIGILFIAVLAIASIIIFIIRISRVKSLIFNEVELNISLGGIGNVKIKSNHETAQIAHKAWSELITRKAGLQFDPEHDIIFEIYNSWYQLFAEIRTLIKQIPAGHLKNKNTKKLINLLVDSLNKGLRPHLTKWQARFRKWYLAELENEENKNKTPQEIQRTYPHYEDLLSDLLAINQHLVAYTHELKKLTL